MFESIKNLGEALLAQGQITFDIAPLNVRKKEEEELLLARVIFDFDNKKLDCDPYLKYYEKSLEEFLWVGNARGQKPQLVLTTNNPEYLLNPNKGNKWAIGQILEEITKRKFEWHEIIELHDILNEIKKTFFIPAKNLTKELEEILKDKVQSGRVVLYTLSVRKGSKLMDLVKMDGYRKFLQYVLYETGEVVRGRCHICGEIKQVLLEPAYPEGSILCIYNIDKIGFISNLERSPENLLRTHTICVDCKRKLRVGLRYIERELRATIGKLNVFIIPTFAGAVELSKILEVLPKLKDAINVAILYERLEEIEEKLNELKWFEGQSSIYQINVLFGKSESSHFVYQHLIQNVPVTRLIQIGEELIKSSKKFMGIFRGNSRRWRMNFAEIYRIFPLRISREGVEWKHIVELFDAMLSDYLYPADELVRRAVLFAKIHRYGTYELYNISQSSVNPDEVMCEGLLKYILLLNVLRNMGIVKMEAETLKEVDVLDEDMKNFLKEQAFGEWQAALFLLGVLIGKIGREQYKKRDEKKSVLDKIGFDGSPVERIKVLVNYVLKGLRDYKILNAENEKLYGCMKTLLDRNIDKLRNPIDNTFYLLSGYAYITMRSISFGDDK